MTASSPNAEPTSDGVRLNILVVDDDSDFADSLAWLLRHKGHQAHTAGNALDAVTAVVGHCFDVIFLDIRLPGLTGHDLARWVRGNKDESEKSPYLIALTGFGSDDDRQTATKIGIDQFLLKPLDPARLDDLLASARR